MVAPPHHLLSCVSRNDVLIIWWRWVILVKINFACVLVTDFLDFGKTEVEIKTKEITLSQKRREVASG